MKHLIKALTVILLFSSSYAFAQPATVSYPYAVGRTGCGSGTQQTHYYTYNGTTNTIANATGGLVGSCIPQLRIGLPANGTQRFTSNLASVSFNPRDHKIYYFWTAYPPSTLAPGGVARTYAWSWNMGSCPGTSTNKLDTIRSFPADILGVAFDNNGKGYILEFTGEPSGQPHKAMIRSIDFTTGVLGVADTLAVTGGAKIYVTGSGDVAMSPSGQMFFVVDNKLFTPNYQSYTGTASHLTCTYIDTVKTTNNFVGLTYAEGETIAAYSGGGCPFEEIKPLTAVNSPITKSGTVNSAADLATIISGIGASKNLVSYTLVSAGVYDVAYNVYIKNYGNTDVTNVQVRDNLAGITGSAANVLSVSTSFISNPAGLTLNGSFNGTTNTNLLNGTGTLPNYPVANNNATIRINVRLSGIANGVVYNNSAIVTGTGFNSQSLRDSSTNGTEPDLNSNDKPDDTGEGQPTPLLITITAQTPPCASLAQTLYTQNFGTGAGKSASFPASPTAGSGYTGSITHPLPLDRFMVADNAIAGDSTRFVSLTDHTGGGRMLLVNADVNNTVFYRDTISTLCPNQQYSLIFWAAFVGNSAYSTICDAFGGFKYPKVKMRMRDLVSGAIITEISTTDITSNTWSQYGMKFIMPSGFPNVIFELINDAPGGCGNDIAIDDIAMGTCDALPQVSISASTGGCTGFAATFNASLNDVSVIPGTKVYQWQISTDNVTWTDITGATSATYTIASVGAGNTNKYYRVLVAATGNMATPSCRYASAGYYLTAKTTSSPATSISQSRTAICPGDPVRLTVNGGTLGSNAVWTWYTGSCGGTQIGTGTSIVVNPTGPTTYYVRAVGDCNTTTCISITLTMSCDIDDDDDGIPDYVEGNGVDPSGDDDADGILNFRDTDLAGGFIDSNGDGVNDRFDADLDGVPNHLDLDSDNDGIPDVVESGGVDTNGDGRIDNYVDTDGDGFSQNVDGNNTGAAGSGNGLGAIDTDGDGVPNFLDLDSDNDGIPDVVEVYGIDANNNGRIDGYTDTDNDGFSNNVDGDVGNDGVAENAANALLRTGTDTDGDGRANSYPYKNMDNDRVANPYDLDSDSDGITDVREAGFGDTDYNGKIDGTINANGWSTTVAALSSLTLPNTDTSGRPNAYDIDSDNDGIPDNVEGQSTTTYHLPSGTDTDGDGIDNAYDNFNGFGGDGIHVFDLDGDTIPDYMDTDTDGDGLLDIIEGNDLNLNGLPDDIVTLTGVDTDGDGLDDRFDTNNSSAEGTSRYMGNGGTTTGAVTAGSITTVQHTIVAAYGCPSERDWRCNGYVLSCNFNAFKGSVQDNTVTLDWTVVCRQEVDHFTIERSVNGVSFTTIGSIPAKPVTNESDSYLANDDISGLNSEIVYYRLKTVLKDNKTSYSNTITILLSNRKRPDVLVYPNPVKDYLQLSINADANYTAKIYIVSTSGKRIHEYTERVRRGSNTFRYNDASGMSEGVYYLLVNYGDKTVSRKFSIVK